MYVTGQCPPKYDFHLKNANRKDNFQILIFSFLKQAFKWIPFIGMLFFWIPPFRTCVSLGQIWPTKGTCDKLTKALNPEDLHRIDSKSLEIYFLMQVNPITRIPYSCTCSSDKKKRKWEDDKNVNKSLLRIRRSPCPQMESVIHCLCLAPHFSTTHLDQFQDHSPFTLFLIFNI